MIPVRKGSKRVPGKALRKIGSETLLDIAIRQALSNFKPQQVYLNTNWLELREIADYYGISFYQRSESLCEDTSTNDQFMHDFLKHIDCKRVVQLLPTSPFLSDQEFLDFCSVAAAHVNSDESIISVGSHRIGCVTEFGEPINFDRLQVNPPSQEMTAIYSYATVLMSWSKKFFESAMTMRGSAYHGDSSNIYFRLRHLSLLDIDTENDYQEALRLSDMIMGNGVSK